MAGTRVDETRSGLPDHIANDEDMLRVLSAANRHQVSNDDDAAQSQTNDDDDSFWDESYDRFSEFAGGVRDEAHAAATRIRQTGRKAEKLGDEFLHSATEPARKTWKSVKEIVGAATTAPADAVRGLQNGQAAVGTIAADLSLHEGVGGKVGEKIHYQVKRDGDHYTATFEMSGELAAGIGVEGEDVGVAANATVGRTVRVVLTAEGDEGRDELAKLLAPSQIGNLTGMPNTHLERIESTRSGGASASADALVAKLGQSADLSTTHGVFFGSRTERLISRSEARVAVECGGPTLIAGDPAASARVVAQAIRMQQPGLVIPEDILREMIDASGGAISGKLSVEARVSLENLSGVDGKVSKTAATIELTLSIGGRKADVKLTGSVTPAQSAAIRKALDDGNVSAAMKAIAANGDLEVTASRFRGFAVDAGPIDFENGVESTRKVDVDANLRLLQRSLR